MHLSTINTAPWHKMISILALLGVLSMVFFPVHYHLQHDDHGADSHHHGHTEHTHAVNISEHHHLDVHTDLGNISDYDPSNGDHVLSPYDDAGTQSSIAKLFPFVAVLAFVFSIGCSNKLNHRFRLAEAAKHYQSLRLLTPPLRAPPRL